MARHRKSAKKVAAGKALASRLSRDENGKFIKAGAVSAEPEIKTEKVEYVNRYAKNTDTELTINRALKNSDSNGHRLRSARAVALKMRLGEDV